MSRRQGNRGGFRSISFRIRFLQFALADVRRGQRGRRNQGCGPWRQLGADWFRGEVLDSRRCRHLGSRGREIRIRKAECRIETQDLVTGQWAFVPLRRCGDVRGGAVRRTIRHRLLSRNGFNCSVRLLSAVRMVHWIGTRRPQRRLRIPLRLQAYPRGPNRRRIKWNRGKGWLRFGRGGGSPRQPGHRNWVRTGIQRRTIRAGGPHGCHGILLLPRMCPGGNRRRRIMWNRGNGWPRFGRSTGSPRQSRRRNRVRTGTQRGFQNRRIIRAERPLQNRRRYRLSRIAGNDGRGRPRFGRGTGSHRQPVGCGRAGHRIWRSRIHIRSPLPTGAGFAALQRLRNRGVDRGGGRGVFQQGRGGFRVRRHPRRHHIDRGRERQGAPWSGNRDRETEGDPGRIRIVG